MRSSVRRCRRSGRRTLRGEVVSRDFSVPAIQPAYFTPQEKKAALPCVALREPGLESPGYQHADGIVRVTLTSRRGA
jgi:rRNA maturation protein Nop10